MNHQIIERDQIVERYLAGRLSVDEERTFEEHYLRCPACLDRLDVETDFQIGIQQVAAEDASRPEDRSVDQASPVSPRTGSAMVFLAMAAAILMAIAAAYLGLGLSGERNRSRQLATRLDEALSPRANPLILDLAVLRGDQAPAVQLVTPPTARPIVFQLELDRPDHEQYRATLEVDQGNEDRKALWSAEDLAPNHLESLTISVDSAFLPPGDYAIRVDSPTPGGDWRMVATYRFRIIDGDGDRVGSAPPIE